MKLNSNQIMEIIKRKGDFVVTWQWKNDYLRSMCKGLVTEGKIRRVQSSRGVDVYKLK